MTKKTTIQVRKLQLTFIEVIVASAVMAIMFVPLTIFLTTGVSTTTRNNEETLGLSLCRSLMTEIIESTDFNDLKTALEASPNPKTDTIIIRNFRTLKKYGGRPLCPTAADIPPGIYKLTSGTSSIDIKGINYSFELTARNYPITLGYLKNPPPDATGRWYPFSTANTVPPADFRHTTKSPANMRYIEKIIDAGNPASFSVNYNSTNAVPLPDIVFLKVVLTVRWLGKDGKNKLIQLLSFKGDLSKDL